MYTVNSIANYFIEQGVRHQNLINPMKLQKLVYFAHGVSLGFSKKPLINEAVMAWQFGPVLKKLYHKTKMYGNTPIFMPIVDSKFFSKFIYVVEENDDSTIEILDEVWDVFGNRDALELADMAHKKGSPWDQVYEKGSEDTPIDNSIIKNYFEKSFLL